MDPSPQLANFEDYKLFLTMCDKAQESLKQQMENALSKSEYTASAARNDINTFRDSALKMKQEASKVINKYFKEYPDGNRPLEDEILLYNTGEAWRTFSQSDFPEVYFSLIKKTAVIRGDLNRYQEEMNKIMAEIKKFQKQVAEFFRIYRIGSLNPAGLTAVLWKKGIEKLDDYILSFRKDYFEEVSRILDKEGNDTKPMIRSRLGKLLEKMNPAFALDFFGNSLTLMLEKHVQQLKGRDSFADCLDRMLKGRRDRSVEIVDGFKGRTPQQALTEAVKALINNQEKWSVLDNFMQELHELAEDATTSFVDVYMEYDNLTEELRQEWLTREIWKPHFAPVTINYSFESYLEDLQRAVKEAEDKLNEKTKIITAEIIQEIHGYIKEQREMNG